MRKFDNFGCFARDVGASCSDNRQRAAIGLQESDQVLGGFLVPEHWAEEILTTIFDGAPSPVSAVREFVFDGPGNTLHVPGVDETSRADGYRWGAVVADFALEGVQPPFSAPHFKDTEFAAEKMTTLVRMSSELWMDVPALGDFLIEAIADEMRHKLQSYMFTPAGTGAQIPLSVLHSPALISVNVAGNGPGTIISQNLFDMWFSLPAASRPRAIWVASESATRYLVQAGIAPIYPVSGATNPDDIPRIFGRPVYEIDGAPAIGTPGDLLLIDPAWYGVARKPSNQAFSADCLFTSNEVLFRVNTRIMGRPLVTAPLTASDGARRSPFIALAQR
jgi:HK97 family phage major capsid protein